MATAKPVVWFERGVLPELLEDARERCTLLGPATATPDDPLSAIGEAEGALAGTFKYNAALMDRAPKLKVIARTGIGYDSVDLDAATERGIAVCNAPDGPTISTAEHAVTLMLMAAKNIKASEADLRKGGDGFYARHRGIELAGKHLGLVGFGRIPRRVARTAAALGMTVAIYDPYVTGEIIPLDITRKDSVEALITDADVVSVHAPLTPETRGLFDDAMFARMKDGAVFVNTARGGLVDLAALERALDSGKLFGAGLDVTDPEPLPPDHPILARNDVVVTPHVAAGTDEAKRGNFLGAFEQVLQVLAGERPPHLVNPKVWENRRQ